MPRFPQTSQVSQRVRFSSFGPFAQRMAELLEEGSLIPLHLGDTYLLPPKEARGIDLDGESIHRYGPIAGTAALRRALSHRMRNRYGLGGSEDNVFFTPGSTGALSIAVEALFDPGDEVILLTPSWPLIFGILQRRGVVIRELPVGECGVPEGSAASFREGLLALCNEKTAGVYFCDPNNPSGFIYPDDWLESLAEVVERHDLWVLSDIAYGDLVFVDGYRTAASRGAFAERCITVGTFSKIFALAGQRAGFLHAPDKALGLIGRLLTHLTYHSSRSAQEMVLACLEGDVGEEVARSYAEGAALTARLLEGRFTPARAGAFVFLDLRGLGIRNEEETMAFLLKCLEAGVSLCPGRVFGQDFAPFARLCYTCVPLDSLERGLRILNPLLRES